jgi:hypothetical protein
MVIPSLLAISSSFCFTPTSWYDMIESCPIEKIIRLPRGPAS